MMKLRLRQRWINPVLDKEFRLRMRTVRSPLALMVYLIVIGLLALGFLYVTTNNFGGTSFDPDRSRDMFYFLSGAQLCLIGFMTPGLTAGIISGEREKQTLNILLTTQQSSAAIVLSKLVGSLSFMLLVVFATLPIYSIVFLFGGISPGQVALVFAFFIFTMLVIGSIGLLCSVLFKRTMVSVIVTYGLTGFIYGGTALLFLFLEELRRDLIRMNGLPQDAYAWVGHVMSANPIAALLSIFEPDITESLLLMGNISPGKEPLFTLWQEFGMFYALVIVLLLLLSIRYIRPVRKKWIGKRG